MSNSLRDGMSPSELARQLNFDSALKKKEVREPEINENVKAAPTLLSEILNNCSTKKTIVSEPSENLQERITKLEKVINEKFDLVSNRQSELYDIQKRLKESVSSLSSSVSSLRYELNDNINSIQKQLNHYKDRVITSCRHFVLITFALSIISAGLYYSYQYAFQTSAPQKAEGIPKKTELFKDKADKLIKPSLKTRQSSSKRFKKKRLLKFQQKLRRGWRRR